MKRIIGFTLVIALIFQCLSKLGLIAFYHLYTEYVIEEYCENKDQPQLQCEGTCFLKKGLKKNDNNAKNTSEALKQLEIPAFIPSSHVKEPIIFTSFHVQFPRVNNAYLFLYTSTPFQPPQVMRFRSPAVYS